MVDDGVSETINDVWCVNITGEMFYLLQLEKKFSEARACFYAAEILLGLEYLHQEGVIYRYCIGSNMLLYQIDIYLILHTPQ